MIPAIAIPMIFKSISMASLLIQYEWKVTDIAKLTIGITFFLKLFRNLLFKSHSPYMSIPGM
jgi:hypothetical protein